VAPARSNVSLSVEPTKSKIKKHGSSLESIQYRQLDHLPVAFRIDAASPLTFDMGNCRYNVYILKSLRIHSFPKGFGLLELGWPISFFIALSISSVRQNFVTKKPSNDELW
jgi:hypothetical protein